MTGVETVRALYEGLAAGDVDAVMSIMAPDIEWTEAAGFPCAGTFIGPEAVVTNVFQRLASEWDGYHAEPEAMLSEGEHVAVLGWYRGAHRMTGRSFRARFVHWYTVTDSTIQRFEQIVDSAEVNAALAPDQGEDAGTAR